MDYKLLSVKNPKWDAYIKLLRTLDDLYYGGHRIADRAVEYLPRRVDERDDKYNERLAGFVYTNILGDAVRDVVSRVCRSPYSVAEWPSSLTFDVRGLSVAVIQRIMRYGEVWHLVSNGGAVTFIDPQTILDFEVTDTGVIDWVKTEVVRSRRGPYGGGNGDIKIVTLYTSEVIEVYGYGSDGTVVEETTIAHSLGRCPVQRYQNRDLWVMNHGYLKALQHLRIENGHTGAASNVDQIQRLFKPSQFLVEGPEGYIDEEQRTALANVRSSNTSLLIGDDFKFAEPSGRAIDSSANSLTRIAREIRDIVSYGGVYEVAGSLASGRSKDAEFALALDQMATYGRAIVTVLNELLAAIRDIDGYPVTPILGGFDQFDLDQTTQDTKATTAIDLASKALALPPGTLTPTALEALLLHLNTVVSRSTDQETLERITLEVSSIRL